MTAIGAGRVDDNAHSGRSRTAPLVPAAVANHDPVVVPFCLPDTANVSQTTFVRSTYGATRRFNPLALLASAGAVLTIVGTLATLQMTGSAKAPSSLTVVSLETLDTTPPPPPPPAPATPTKAKSSVAPPSVPKPMIQVPSPGPVRIALETPPPPVTVATAPPPTTPVAHEAPAAVNVAPSSTVEGGDLSSRLLAARPPVYPVESRRAHEQGTVRLLVLVGTDGAVQDISLAASSGSARLDKAALRAVRHWRWQPTVRDGMAVLVRGIVTIPFILKN